MPRRVRGVAGNAVPCRVGVGGSGASQRVPLREAARLAVTAFRLLDLRQQQPQPALVEAGGGGGLGLAPGLARETGLQRRARQKQSAFGMLRIGFGQPLRRLRALQRLTHRRQCELGEIGLRRDGPTVPDGGQRPGLASRRTQARGVGQCRRRQRRIVLPGVLRQ